MRRKYVEYIRAVTVFALLAAVSSLFAPASAAPVTITFIHFNDLHAHLTPHADLVPDAPLGQTSTRTKVVERGGLARLATLVKRIRADNPNSVLMNIGDTYHGGVEAFYTNGNAIIEPVNALHIDVGVVGNWDYAYGPLVTRMRYTNLPITHLMKPMQRMSSNMARRGGPMQRFREGRNNDDSEEESSRGLDLMMPFGEIKRPNFPNLAANVTLSMPPMMRGKLMMPATMMKNMHGVKVGFIGLTSDIVPRMHKMLAFGMTFVEGENNYRDLVNRYQKQLRAEGATVIVVMSELGLQKNYRLAQVIEPGVDVIFSAHTHEAVFKPLTSHSGALVVEAGNDGYVGRMDVTVDHGRVLDRQWQLTPIDASIPEDAEMKALVDKARAPFLARNVNLSLPMPMMHQKLTRPINTVIGHTDVPLDRRQVLESRFNDFMGEIMRRAAGSDIAITPGFRFDSVVGGKAIPVEDNTVAAGDITLEDVYRYFPVPYTISTAEIDGVHLRGVLEEALTNVFSPDVFKQSGGWLEGFAGLDASLDLAKPDGRRVIGMRLKGSGNVISASSILKVAGCSRLMDASDTLCSYAGFRDVQALRNARTGQAWTPVDLFVEAVANGVPAFDSTPNLKDSSGFNSWPKTPFIQPLEGLGGNRPSSSFP